MRALAFALLLLAISATGCSSSSSGGKQSSIIGTWVVRDSAAPFPVHMYVFNADGTMQQANPDAGDPRTSDSDGKGVWISDGDRVKGKWVEITADRTSHKFAGRGEITFELSVHGDTLIGTETARFYDTDDKPVGGSLDSTLRGSRVTVR
jgi:hypothetical protein